MADRHSVEQRRFNMSKVRSKNTKPELVVRKFLFSKGFRYRLHDENLPGKPDIVLPKYKTVIFVNGCFWHGHVNCKYAAIPKTRTEWWTGKIDRNVANDILRKNELTRKGWHIIYVWTCQLKRASKEQTLNFLFDELKKAEPSLR